MTAEPSTPPGGHGRDEESASLLARISNEMVRAQKEFFGKGPTKAKTYLLDDMVLVVMRDSMTTAEKTMLEFGHAGQVREFRQLYQDAMSDRLTMKMEELTGRKIVNYQSQVLFDPDLVVEVFVFDSEGSSDIIEATAESQRGDLHTGMATDDEALDPPSSSGQ